MTEVYNNINVFFRDGGLFLYPIAIVFAFGIAIAIERWLFLTREKVRNVKAFREFLPLLRSTDMEKMHQYSRENTAPVTRIIACGLDMMKVSKQRADVENSMSEGMLETLPKLEKRTGYLSVLANVATLLGLLGTIVGLIGAFTAVSDADPAQKSQLLSSSIAVAMNTTAFGLIAAIPLLILHAILQNKTGAIVSSIEMSAVKFLNLMTLNRFIEAGLARSAYENINPSATSPVQPSSAAQPVPHPPQEMSAVPVTHVQSAPVAQAAPQSAPVTQAAPHSVQEPSPAPVPVPPTHQPTQETTLTTQATTAVETPPQAGQQVTVAPATLTTESAPVEANAPEQKPESTDNSPASDATESMTETSKDQSVETQTADNNASTNVEQKLAN